MLKDRVKRLAFGELGGKSYQAIPYKAGYTLQEV